MKNVTIRVHNATEKVQEFRVATQSGKPLRIKAEKNVNYEFFDESIGFAPNHIITKRVGDDLHVSFETDGRADNLIVEGYYHSDAHLLVGVAEDGNYYYYIPDTGEIEDFVTQLKAGDVEGAALGGEPQIVPLWLPLPPSFPWWWAVAVVPFLFIKGGDDDEPTPTPPAPQPESQANPNKVVKQEVVPVTQKVTEDDKNVDPTTVKLINPYTKKEVDSFEVPGQGTWSVEPGTDKVTFTPSPELVANPANPAPITYTVKGQDGKTLTAAVEVSYPSITTADVKPGEVGKPVTQNVLSNDGKDIKPETLKLVDPKTKQPVDEVKVPGEGTWTVVKDGSGKPTGEITFTPEPGFTKDPTPAIYVVEDKNGTFHPTPVAVNYPANLRPDTKEGKPGQTVTQNVTDNDNDVDPTTIQLVDPTSKQPVDEVKVPGEGTWTVVKDPSGKPTGEIKFTPEPTFKGDPSPVTYTGKDKDGEDVSPTTVDVMVRSLQPLANNDKKSGTVAREPVTQYVPENDKDIEPTSVKLVDPQDPVDAAGNPKGVDTVVVPGEGTWKTDGNGNVTFESEPTFKGDPTPITYVATDANGEPVTATVSVDYPDIKPTTTTPDVKVGVPGQPATVDVTENDGNVDPTTVQLIDPTSGQPVDEVNVPGEGTWTVVKDQSGKPTGEITFTPEPGFTQSPTPVTYTVTDKGTNQPLPPTGVSVTYQDPATPVANDDTKVGETGKPVTVNVLGNDSATLDPTTVQLVDPATQQPVDEINVPGEGTWVVDKDPTSGKPTGTVTFTPEPAFKGDPKPVTYTAKDVNDKAVTATVTVDYPELTKPVILDDTKVGETGNPVTVKVINNDPVNIDPTTVQLVDPTSKQPVDEVKVPGEGTWTVVKDPSGKPTGEITFTPEPTLKGDPSPVTYIAKDTDGQPAEPATISIDYPASLRPDTKEGKPGQTVTQNVTDNDNDVDPTTIQLVDPTSKQPVDEVKVPGEGTWTVVKDPSGKPTGEIKFTPEPTFKGDPSPVTYTGKDKDGKDVPPTTVDVVTQNVPATTTPDTKVGEPGQPVTINVTENDTNVKPETVKLVDPVTKNPVDEVKVPEGTWTVVKDPSGKPTGEITFTPDNGVTESPKPITYVVDHVDPVDPSNPTLPATPVSVAYPSLVPTVAIESVDAVAVEAGPEGNKDTDANLVYKVTLADSNNKLAEGAKVTVTAAGDGAKPATKDDFSKVLVTVGGTTTEYTPEEFFGTGVEVTVVKGKEPVITLIAKDDNEYENTQGIKLTLSDPKSAKAGDTTEVNLGTKEVSGSVNDEPGNQDPNKPPFDPNDPTNPDKNPKPDTEGDKPAQAHITGLSDVNEGVGNVEYTIHLDKPAKEPVTVTVALTNGKAEKGTDYNEPTTLTVTINPGEEKATIKVPVINDDPNKVYEGPEDYTIAITKVENGEPSQTEPQSVKTTIHDDGTGTTDGRDPKNPDNLPKDPVTGKPVEPTKPFDPTKPVSVDNPDPRTPPATATPDADDDRKEPLVAIQAEDTVAVEAGPEGNKDTDANLVYKVTLADSNNKLAEGAKVTVTAAGDGAKPATKDDFSKVLVTVGGTTTEYTPEEFFGTGVEVTVVKGKEPVITLIAKDDNEYENTQGIKLTLSDPKSAKAGDTTEVNLGTKEVSGSVNDEPGNQDPNKPPFDPNDPTNPDKNPKPDTEGDKPAQAHITGLSDVNEGVGNVEYTIHLDKPAKEPVTVTVALTNGKAEKGTDYNEPTTLTVTINPGEEKATIKVPVINDDPNKVYEGPEDYTIAITKVENGEPSQTEPQSVKTTIHDDGTGTTDGRDPKNPDNLPKDPVTGKPVEPTKPFDPTKPVSVDNPDPRTPPATATPDADDDRKEPLVAIQAEDTVAVEAGPEGNKDTDANLVYKVTLADSNNKLAEGAKVTVTAAGDGAKPATKDDFSKVLVTVGGTTTEYTPEEFFGTGVEVTVVKGKEPVITLIAKDDNEYENTQGIKLTLSDPKSAKAGDTTEVNLGTKEVSGSVNDEPGNQDPNKPPFDPNDPTNPDKNPKPDTEGDKPAQAHITGLSDVNEGVGNVEYTIHLDKPAKEPVTVTVALTNGKAEKGTDYNEPTTLTVTINPGEEKATIKVPVINDDPNKVYEGPEDYTIAITKVENGEPSQTEPQSVKTTIHDDGTGTTDGRDPKNPDNLPKDPVTGKPVEPTKPFDPTKPVSVDNPDPRTPPATATPDADDDRKEPLVAIQAEDTVAVEAGPEGNKDTDANLVYKVTLADSNNKLAEGAKVTVTAAGDGAKPATKDDFSKVLVTVGGTTTEYTPEEFFGTGVEVTVVKGKEPVITLIAKDDNEYENTQGIKLTLSDPKSAKAGDTTEVNLGTKEVSGSVNDEPGNQDPNKPPFDPNDPTNPDKNPKPDTEGDKPAQAHITGLSDVNEGVGNVEYTIHLDKPAKEPVTVTVALTNGKAEKGTDYNEPTTLTVTINPGEEKATIKVPVINDDPNKVYEGPEDYTIAITKVENGEPSQTEPQSVKTTIHDDGTGTTDGRDPKNPDNLPKDPVTGKPVEPTKPFDPTKPVSVDNPDPRTPPATATPDADDDRKEPLVAIQAEDTVAVEAGPEGNKDTDANLVYKVTLADSNNKLAEGAKVTVTAAGDGAKPATKDDFSKVLVTVGGTTTEYTPEEFFGTGVEVTVVKGKEPVITLIAKDDNEYENTQGIKLTLSDPKSAKAGDTTEVNLGTKEVSGSVNDEPGNQDPNKPPFDPNDPTNPDKNPKPDTEGDKPAQAHITGLSDVNEGVGNVEYTIHLDKPAKEPVTVTVALTNGKAEKGTDYNEPTTLTVTINPGEEKATIKVPVINDDPNKVYEGPEDYTIAITKVENGEPSQTEPQSVKTTIHDDGTGTTDGRDPKNPDNLPKDPVTGKPVEPTKPFDPTKPVSVDNPDPRTPPATATPDADDDRNRAPVAKPNTASGNEDTPIKGNVLTDNSPAGEKDSDPDGNPLTVTTFTVAGKPTVPAGTPVTIDGVGTVKIEPNGDYTFTPEPNFNGPVPTITYTITDGKVPADQQPSSTLDLTVNPVNDPPVANPDTNAGKAGDTLTGNVINGKDGQGKDTDVDGDTLTVTGVTVGGTNIPVGVPTEIPGVGTITVNSNGDYTFVPKDNTVTSIPVINYTISDGNGGESSSTLTLTANELPTVNLTGPESVKESQGTADYTFTLTKPAEGVVTITYKVVPASGGGVNPAEEADFTGVTFDQIETVTITGPATSATVKLPIKNDALYEGKETYVVEMVSVSSNVLKGTDTVTTVVDDFATETDSNKDKPTIELNPPAHVSEEGLVGGHPDNSSVTHTKPELADGTAVTATTPNNHDYDITNATSTTGIIKVAKVDLTDTTITNRLSINLDASSATSLTAGGVDLTWTGPVEKGNKFVYAAQKPTTTTISSLTYKDAAGILQTIVDTEAIKTFAEESLITPSKLATITSVSYTKTGETSSQTATQASDIQKVVDGSVADVVRIEVDKVGQKGTGPDADKLIFGYTSTLLKQIDHLDENGKPVEGENNLAVKFTVKLNDSNAVIETATEKAVVIIEDDMPSKDTVEHFIQVPHDTVKVSGLQAGFTNARVYDTETNTSSAWGHNGTAGEVTSINAQGNIVVTRTEHLYSNGRPYTATYITEHKYNQPVDKMLAGDTAVSTTGTLYSDAFYEDWKEDNTEDGYRAPNSATTPQQITSGTDLGNVLAERIWWGSATNPGNKGFYQMDDNNNLKSGLTLGDLEENISFGTFSHQNYPTSVPYLESVALQVNFRVDVNGIEVQSPPIDFAMSHFETANIRTGLVGTGVTIGGNLEPTDTADRTTFFREAGKIDAKSADFVVLQQNDKVIQIGSTTYRMVVDGLLSQKFKNAVETNKATIEAGGQAALDAFAAVVKDAIAYTYYDIKGARATNASDVALITGTDTLPADHPYKNAIQAGGKEAIAAFIKGAAAFEQMKNLMFFELAFEEPHGVSLPGAVTDSLKTQFEAKFGTQAVAELKALNLADISDVGERFAKAQAFLDKYDMVIGQSYESQLNPFSVEAHLEPLTPRIELETDVSVLGKVHVGADAKEQNDVLWVAEVKPGNHIQSVKYYADENGKVETTQENALITVITTDYGVLTGNKSGSYTFSGSSKLPELVGKGASSNFVFNYSYKDSDGDTIVSDIKFNFTGLTDADMSQGNRTDLDREAFDTNDYLVGSSQDDVIKGGKGDDVLIGDAGKDQLLGGEGNDVLFFDKNDTLVDGGIGGFDTLTFAAWLEVESGTTNFKPIDFTNTEFYGGVTNIEMLDLRNDLRPEDSKDTEIANTLKINKAAVVSISEVLSGGGHELYIAGSGKDTVDIAESFVKGASKTEAGVTYNLYTINNDDSVKLYIQDGITVL